MQALMGVKGIYDAKEVHIHLLGTPAEGDYKRPFKAAPGMFGAGESHKPPALYSGLRFLYSGRRRRPGDGRGEHCRGGEAGGQED
jgi:hypothetical protein